MQDFELKGKVDVSLYGVTIPASLLSGDDGVVTNAEEKTIEINSLDGVITQGTRIFDNVNVTFSVILPSMDYMKNILPDLYEAGTGGQTVGRIAIGGNDCAVAENTPLVVHYSCQEDSDNDIYVPNANVIATFELTQNSDDPVMVSFTANALPSLEDDGVKMFLGTGSLTEKTLWNAEEEAYEPVAS